jgi:hypothetical protein
MTSPAWLFKAPIYEVSALPSHAPTSPSGTFLLCATTDISTWLQQLVYIGTVVERAMHESVIGLFLSELGAGEVSARLLGITFQ